MRAKVSKSHSSFCTAVPGEGRGPLDLEALAEGADTGIHNADFVSKQPASRLVLPHQPFLLPSPWFPFTARHARSLLGHHLDRARLAILPWKDSASPEALTKVSISFYEQAR